MKITGRSLAVLASLFCAASAAVHAAPGYRLVPLDDGKSRTDIFGLNNRGVVVGMRNTGSGTHAFSWRAGTFTDLHDAVDPSVSYTQATGINDLGAIVGDKWNGAEFEGWLLRDGAVSPLTVPGGSQLFPFDINNAGQIIIDATVNGRDEFYLIDGGNVQRLDGPGGSNDGIFARVINNRGVVAGNTFAEGAVLWQDGTAQSLGVPPGATASGAVDVNDRNQVAGSLTIGGAPQAAWWHDGTWTVLPELNATQQQSEAVGINYWGMVVGQVYDFNQQPAPATATLWFAGRAFDLNALVRADDPLKPYVHLGSVERINDRGDIIVHGVDSRTHLLVMYFATLFDN
jgi:probable HAF family extracellular repeat protein